MPLEPDYKALYQAEQVRTSELQAENDRLTRDNLSLNQRLRLAAEQFGQLRDTMRQMGEAAQQIQRVVDEATAASHESDPTKPGGS